MPHARLFPRALLAVLVAGLLVLTPALVPAMSGMWTAPAQAVPHPADPDSGETASGVALDLVSLTPTSLSDDDRLTAVVEVTNTSGETLHDPTLELRTRTARVTDRSVLMDWASRTGPDSFGRPVVSSSLGAALAPGQSQRIRIEADPEELGYGPEPYFWGTRRISLTLTTDAGPLDALWTFTVWRPEGSDATLGASVLLPVSAPDPAMTAADPQRTAQSMTDGSLADLRTVAEHPGVDWWLDPALLDPPLLPATAAASDGESGTSASTPPAPDPAAEEYARSLAELAGDRTVLTSPYDRADLASMQAAGTGQLTEGISSAGEEALRDRAVTGTSSAGSLPASQASPDSVRRLHGTGAQTLIIPSSSLRLDPLSTVTPSSAATVVDGEERIPVLAPDPELTAAFTEISAGHDPEAATALLLAETATIASDQVTGPRQVLIAPAPRSELAPQAITDALDAMDEAPWLVRQPTENLLEAAQDGAMTTSTTDGSGDLYAVGEVPIDQVRPSGPDETGRFVHRGEAGSEQSLDPQALQSLEAQWARMESLATVLGDTADLDVVRHQLLAGTSSQWRGDPDRIRARATAAQEELDAVHRKIQVVPASSYNVISDNPQVPVTLTNDLDTPVTVQPVVTVEKRLVRVTQVDPVTIPAHGQVEVSFPMEAIASGTITMRVHLETPQGANLGVPGETTLSVNPAWESWTTLLLVIAMSVLVVVGVARARRTGSDTRAPAQRGPEDPVELSRSGRSRPPREGDAVSGPAPGEDGRGSGDPDPPGPAESPPSDPDVTDPDPSPSDASPSDRDPEPPAPERPRSTE